MCCLHHRRACFLFVFVVSSFSVVVYSQQNEDEVITLPGISSKLLKFKHYSGYLNATGTRRFHYWFVESEGDPVKDPLVLWLNGGPGCSSLIGFLSENGPFLPNDDGATLSLNPYRWNRLANMLFLESPAGVGFSYSSNKTYKTSDDEVAEDNYQALQHFFLKFPSFTVNSFYLSGESYAGIYVPTLGVKILEGNATINMQGFAIGNPYLNASINSNSLMYYAFWHGIASAQVWEEMLQNCCDGDNCNFYQPSNTICKDNVDIVRSLTYTKGLNPYAMYMDCYKGIPPHLHQYIINMEGIYPDFKSTWKKLEKEKFNRPKVVAAPTLGGQRKLNEWNCINNTAETAYLNLATVRKAIHIPTTLPVWSSCSDAVSSLYVRNYQDMTPQFKKLLRSYRALIYHGDTDLMCNFLQGEWFVESLKQPLKLQHRAWMYNGQVAGFVKDFDNLTYMTVKGSGHMVPQFKPAQAFQMFSNFLNSKPQ